MPILPENASLSDVMLPVQAASVNPDFLFSVDNPAGPSFR
jgi:hypothetical protein